MVEYIKKSDALSVLEHCAMWNRDLNAAYDGIKAIPSAEVAVAKNATATDADKVKHGSWSIRCETHHDTYTGEVDEEFYLECSECKRQVWDVSQDAILMGDYRSAVANFPYCHCGAKMDAERRASDG